MENESSDCVDFLNLVETRCSVRALTDEPVSDTVLEKILHAACRAPSAGNRQAYRMVVVRDAKTAEKLSKAAWNQPPPKQAPVSIVFFADPEVSAKSYGERGECLYCIQDATIAATVAHFAAAALGLGSVWIGAFDPEEVSKILNAPKGLIPVAILPIGHPARETEPTGRRPAEEMTIWENF